VELEPVNLEKLIDSILADYATLQPPNADVEVTKPLLPVLGHEAFLTQCLSNLLGNSVKFVPPGVKPHVQIKTIPLSTGVEIQIEDNGIGIAAQDQKRIFGIFQRVHAPTSFEGTGIGLAIVQKAVERMGGRVGVESSLGHGSRFWVRLRGARA
jgi:signal transduction histidine kinase